MSNVIPFPADAVHSIGFDITIGASRMADKPFAVLVVRPDHFECLSYFDTLATARAYADNTSRDLPCSSYVDTFLTCPTPRTLGRGRYSPEDWMHPHFAELTEASPRESGDDA